MILSYLDFLLISPEIILFLFASFTLIINIFYENKKNNILFFSIIFILIILLMIFYYQYINKLFGTAFYDLLIIDKLTLFLKCVTTLVTLLSIIYGYDYIKNNIENNKGEFYVLIMFALIGQMLLISANNLVVIYLGIELMSLSLYPLIVIQKNNKLAIEAAVKYFILSLLSSGILLYGFSILYGITGTLDINSMFTNISNFNKLYNFSFTFIIIGLIFKLGIVPFHMWMPDVYQGAPTIITSIISSGPKIAIITILFRLLNLFIEVDKDYISTIILYLSIASIILGNILAVMQSNFKRLLAYSAISHMGFVLLALANNNIEFALFYLISYLLTSIPCFGIIMYLSYKNFEFQNIRDFNKLYKYKPFLSFYILMIMLSMAGIPPMIGFYAKLIIFKNLIDFGYTYITLIIAISSVIGAYYYLNIIKIMYFDNIQSNYDGILNIKDKNNFHLSKIILLLNFVLLLIISILPNLLLVTINKLYL
ncbi:NADH-quinone oxidoreductase subunit N [Candidatus Kinetoplastibacterium sorsogonicusi]|uniref:NADH-quinone oxidoreductase subunit N n=1 Tax=Candidatus Kinetoplastidibacterium kentomonadis TaxID=1576550 RepID=A0A3S7JA87_9PROT|nr:NADH-quinone oxidoreductase subunit N [Candidatus Kinetoplastibacterium sorsogonicusi]AWD32583.1 NADH-quinone oxidoreductase subunit N [Candidatus Kinetoplastibacterium sorsogonicusi]